MAGCRNAQVFPVLSAEDIIDVRRSFASSFVQRHLRVGSIQFAHLGSAGAVLQQSTINFIPYPNATTAFQLNYIPVFRKWATDGSEDQNVFDGVNGWEAGIVWGAVAMALQQQSYVTALRQYLSLLAGLAVMEGVDLEAAETPLVQ